MTSEQTFWVRIWLTIITGILLLITAVGITVTVQHKNSLEALSKSNDPISLACAMEIEDGGTIKTLLCVDKSRK